MSISKFITIHNVNGKRVSVDVTAPMVIIEGTPATRSYVHISGIQVAFEIEMSRRSLIEMIEGRLLDLDAEVKKAALEQHKLQVAYMLEAATPKGYNKVEFPEGDGHAG